MLTVDFDVNVSYKTCQTFPRVSRLQVLLTAAPLVVFIGASCLPRLSLFVRLFLESVLCSVRAVSPSLSVCLSTFIVQSMPGSADPG